jgi:hypothetical protein
MVTQSLDTTVLIRHFYEAMTEQEKIKLKSLNILKSGVIHHRSNKNPLKKNYSVSFPLTMSVNNIPILPASRESRDVRESRESRESRAARIFCPIKEIQMEYLASLNRDSLSPINYFQNGITSINAQHLPLSSNVSSTIKAKRIITKSTKV